MKTEVGTPLLWPEPGSREVGLFTDLTLYAETLELAQEYGSVTAARLQRELSQRMQKMRLVLQQSERTIERLLRELRYYKWLQPGQGTVATSPHIITSDGQVALRLSRRDPHSFRRYLAAKMQQVYVIPGWFIARLWQINPHGQGEVILPAPLNDWWPASRHWDDIAWDDALSTQACAAAHHARGASLHAFPIRDEHWLPAVQQAWERLSQLQPRNRRVQERVVYSPRTRLGFAMREAGVRLLFDRVPYDADAPDFSGNRPPLYVRTFSGWCPRLEALELIFYTDWHPRIAGRLLFPVSVFRATAPAERFEPLAEITHPNGHSLWLHQPTWLALRATFLNTLVTVYQHHATRSGTLYVSLLAIRDEVCRQLRLSSHCFDRFLEQVLKELPSDDFPWSVAVETDIRQDQQGGAGQLRRPVYHEGVPHSLIALARLPRDNRITGRSRV